VVGTIQRRLSLRVATVDDLNNLGKKVGYLKARSIAGSLPKDEEDKVVFDKGADTCQLCGSVLKLSFSVCDECLMRESEDEQEK